MTKQPKARKGPSLSRLTISQRFRYSWTRWRLTKMRKQAIKEERRYRMMLVAMDSQLLLISGLEQKAALAQHQLREMEQSVLFRMQDRLPPELPTQKDQLDELLGL